MSHRRPLSPPQKEDFPEVTDNGLIWLEQIGLHSIDIKVATFTFNPASVGANTTVEQTVTITGLKADDIIISIIKPTLEAGLGVLQGRVSATNTLAIQLINTTASPINAGSETYTLVYIKNSRA